MNAEEYRRAIKALLKNADADILRRVYNFVQRITLHK